MISEEDAALVICRSAVRLHPERNGKVLAQICLVQFQAVVAKLDPLSVMAGYIFGSSAVCPKAGNDCGRVCAALSVGQVFAVK